MRTLLRTMAGALDRWLGIRPSIGPASPRALPVPVLVRNRRP